VHKAVFLQSGEVIRTQPSGVHKQLPTGFLQAKVHHLARMAATSSGGAGGSGDGDPETAVGTPTVCGFGSGSINCELFNAVAATGWRNLQKIGNLNFEHFGALRAWASNKEV